MIPGLNISKYLPETKKNDSIIIPKQREEKKEKVIDVKKLADKSKAVKLVREFEVDDIDLDIDLGLGIKKVKNEIKKNEGRN